MIDVVIVALVVFDVAVNSVMLAMYILDGRSRRAKKMERETDETVEREMKRDFLDEGFENLMAYSVNGENGFSDRTIR